MLTCEDQTAGMGPMELRYYRHYESARGSDEEHRLSTRLRMSFAEKGYRIGEAEFEVELYSV